MKKLLKWNVLGLNAAEKKILVAVFSILFALCSLAYMAYQKSHKLLGSADRIEHAEEIKYHILEVHSTLLDMESGVRGYVMTGDESYMTPTNAAIANIFQHLKELKAANLSGEQLSQVQQLERLVDEKTTYTSRTVEVRRQKGMTEAIYFIGDGREKQLMDRIREHTLAMLNDADTRLNELKVDNTKVIRNFAITFYFLLLKVSVTVVTVIFLFWFYLRKRNKAEATLQEAKKLFQNVLDHTSSVISIKDLTGRYLLINQAYEKLIGKSKEEVKGKTAYDLYEKAEADAIRDNDYEVIRLQKQIITTEVIGKGTEARHFSTLKFPLLDANQIPYAVCSISTDETEKTKVDHQHQEQMQRILDLFNNAPCGYQATNSNGIIIEMNETLLKWLGYDRSEVVGKMPVKNILTEESQQQFAYYFPRIRSGEIKSLFDLKASYLRKDGSKLHLVVNTVASYDNDGNFLHTRTSSFDASFRMRPEEVSAKN